jgi:hypothetical protein
LGQVTRGGENQKLLEQNRSTRSGGDSVVLGREGVEILEREESITGGRRFC